MHFLTKHLLFVGLAAVGGAATTAGAFPAATGPLIAPLCDRDCDPASAQVWTVQGSTLDAQMWQLLKDTDDDGLLVDFIQRFPDSPFVSDAQARLSLLRAAVEGAVAGPDTSLAPEPPLIFGRVRDCDVCPEVVEIAGSDFIFGAPDTFYYAQWDERPALRLPVGQGAIAIATTETSQGEFQAFVDATGHDWPEACWITEPNGPPKLGSRLTDVARGADLPVTCVTWDDANAYAAWLSEMSGANYRLLTEIEHEYIAEALHFNIQTQDRFAGRNVCELVNVADRGSPFSWRNFSCEDALGRGVFPVRSLAPDEFGLYHLLGNVWEWTDSCYTDRPEAPVLGAFILVEAQEACTRRAIRGGGWSDPLTSLTTSNRHWENPDYRSDTLGFRVVRAR